MVGSSPLASNTSLLPVLADQAEREFRGHTFNGYSLLETVRTLDAVTAASTDTYEGYCVWDNVVHVVYFKYFVLRELGLSEPLEPYPWEEGSFPPLVDTSAEAWTRALAYAERVHDAYVAAVRALDERLLESRIDQWECSLLEALIWIPTHDTYHTAQIRNMGLPSLRDAHS